MTVKRLFFLLAFFVFSSFGQNQESLPGEEDFTTMQNQTASAWASFERKALLPLIEYYFNSELVTEKSKNKLYELTEIYENALKDLYAAQIKAKTAIEVYDGDDWDLRYGKNGLWRAFEALSNQTTYLIARCLYYRAICVEKSNRAGFVQEILSRTETINEGVDRFYRYMLESQVYALTRGDQGKTFDEIFRRLEAIELEMTSDTELYYEMWICRLSLTKPFSVIQLNNIIDNFKKSNQSNNPIIAMRLAFLQLQTKNSDFLEDCLKRWSQLANLIAQMLHENAKINLAKGKAADYINSLTLFEQELLAVSLLNEENEKLDNILTSFCMNPEKSSRVLCYTAAIKNALNNPEIAFDCSVNAIEQPLPEIKIFNDITDLNVLTVAAKTGFVLLKNADHTEKVIDVFNRYSQVAGESAEPRLMFAYAVALKDIKPDKAKSLLNKIYQDGGEYADKSLLELLVDKFNNDQRISEEVEALYHRAEKSDKPFYTDLTDLYCRYLAKAGDYEKSIQILSDAYKHLDVHPSCGVYVLRHFFEFAEQAIDDAGSELADNAAVIGEKILSAENDMPEVRLAYIEAAVLSGKTPEQIGEMPEYSEYFDATEYSRAKARYELALSNFTEAAFIWGRIARSLISQETLARWRWQRAKYYQIYCSLKSGQSTSQQIAHSIGVLRADSNWAIGYWDQKIEEIAPIVVDDNQPGTTEQKTEDNPTNQN